MRATAACWLLRLRDGWRMLTFARSQAPSLFVALRRFVAAARVRRRALRGLPAAAQRRLLLAEQVFADIGLAYPRESLEQTAPWHMPFRFLHCPASELPPHPAIDPAYLAALLPAADRSLAAVDVLALLANPAALPQRWARLPIWSEPAPSAVAADVAVCLHLFYAALWPEMAAALARLKAPWALYVSVPVFAAHPAYAEAARAAASVHFLPVANRGRDVMPWLAWMATGALARHPVVCKLHGKHSPHRPDGAAWRARLFDALMGADGGDQIVAAFANDPRLGVLGPAAEWLPMTRSTGWSKNRRHVMRLAQRLGLEPPSADAMFFAGTMFWYRPQALAGLAKIAAVPPAFADEMGQTDGTTAHAVERLVAEVARQAGWVAAGWPAAGRPT